MLQRSHDNKHFLKQILNTLPLYSLVSSSIFLDIVTISVSGINTKNLVGKLICVDILAPFLFVESLFT